MSWTKIGVVGAAIVGAVWFIPDFPGHEPLRKAATSVSAGCGLDGPADKELYDEAVLNVRYGVEADDTYRHFMPLDHSVTEVTPLGHGCKWRVESMVYVNRGGERIRLNYRVDLSPLDLEKGLWAVDRTLEPSE